MLVFDVSRQRTFESVAKWKKEIDERVRLPNGKALPVLLVGILFGLAMDYQLFL